MNSSVLTAWFHAVYAGNIGQEFLPECYWTPRHPAWLFFPDRCGHVGAGIWHFHVSLCHPRTLWTNWRANGSDWPFELSPDEFHPLELHPTGRRGWISRAVPSYDEPDESENSRILNEKKIAHEKYFHTDCENKMKKKKKLFMKKHETYCVKRKMPEKKQHQMKNNRRTPWNLENLKKILQILQKYIKKYKKK